MITRYGGVVRMSLDPNQHQGYFGEAFVRALAAAAGLIATKHDLDVTGTDLLVGYKGSRHGPRHPLIEVQVKSCARRQARWRDGCWRYPLARRHFNNLAGNDFPVPRFLALVIVPDHWQHYAVNKTDLLELRHCAYWLSLTDREQVDPDVSGKVPVDVPAGNILTKEALLRLVTGQEVRVHDGHR
jgi:hypothetical protein